ncbi:Dam family site-specific DNA-(adenine-N6)-methyltransferase [Acidovorax sp. BLS4]|uniref:DNA adenine methylase n=1 Tax=Acidovorax sp. BLS4 TaxID=3273430 RepID=UPI0029423A5B|nr:Dam family site-specific DNA-(adenine-N6)-methyltransferase [Paracidovorax avenae]WOI46504.1 Dam family site-specific DNA-(adenine-N6)-methyltransferase [Paracidovorax avenae]
MQVNSLVLSSDAAATVEPLLRWAGSKKKLLPVLLAAAPHDAERYIEPFAGSAVLFLRLGAGKAILGDFNESLIETYRIVKRYPRAVWEKASMLGNTPDDYYVIRAIPRERLNAFERAAQFVYLNRYCFNGVYRTNRAGQFNVARGKGHLFMPNLDAFKAFAGRLRAADLRCSDFEEILTEAGSGDFVYLDPPYALGDKRDRGEYGCNAFREADERRLIAALRAADRRGAKVLLSYSPAMTVLQGLKKWRRHDLTVTRNVAGFTAARRSADEVLLSNYDWPRGNILTN